MYEAFFGLNRKPFQSNPDPAFYFGSQQHQRATAYLAYGVQCHEGFIVISGEVGVGKTTVVRSLMDGLDADQMVAAHLVTPLFDAQDTLRLVGAAFGVRVKALSQADILMTLEAFFLSQIRLGKRCLLVVDEAQNLGLQAVEALRLLSNFELDSHSLLQTFLIGQPGLRTLLHSADWQPLSQRVTAHCHIGSLAPDETRRYIAHRLQCAGSTGRPTFDAASLDKIHQAAQGIPRRINQIADRLLLLGFLNHQDDFGLPEVTEVVDELQQEAGLPALLPRIADAVGQDIDPLEARLQRLEDSTQRLERLHRDTLTMLHKLVEAAPRPPKEPSP